MSANTVGPGVLIGALAVLLPACSNQQLYDAIQQNRQLECQKLPGIQYEECMKQHSQPYDEYERQRQELLDKEAADG
jgi:hypothetical protein